MTLPSTMRAVVADGGGPETLQVVTRPVPAPGPGEVLIRIEAAGLNGADIAQRRGNYVAPPGATDILGLEAAGTVAALGSGITTFQTGDRVCALLVGGGYAEYVAVPAGQVLPIASGITMIEAGGLVETITTVWANVFDIAKLQRGETLLVHGGTSGIGIMAIQLGRAFGASVIATAGSPKKVAVCQKLGADPAIDYKAEDFADVVKRVRPDGVNVVLDIVGGPYLERNVRCLAVNGRLAMIAMRGDRSAPIDLGRVLMKSLTVFGSRLRARTPEDKARLVADVRREVWPLIESGAVRQMVDSVFPLADVAAAHRAMEASQHVGKIILDLNPVTRAEEPSLRAAYDAQASSGALESDPAQSAVVDQLQALADRLENRTRPAAGWLGLFRPKLSPGSAPQGLYIWGAVGRGKTMLMDLFVDTVRVEPKRRVHFHAFMADVHGRVHAWRQKLKTGEVKGDDPIAAVAAALAAEASLLCFDEFAVTDIADAMILGRLFTALWAAGVVVVATSNVEPDRLYESGLNRALFLSFIAQLKANMDVVELKARTDYRLEKLGGAPVYRVPADAAAKAALDTTFRRLTGRDRGEARTLTVLGHPVRVPEAAGGVARFGFADLCERPLGAIDFLAIAQNFHTVMIDAIPVLDDSGRNVVKRFIVLIDTLYDRHVKLVASAAAEPPFLYRGDSQRELFEFDRTASRLIEMRSDSYLALPHGAGHSRGSGNTAGLVDT